MRKELLKGLTEEQIKKVEACNNNEEIMELAKKEGVELTDEQLEAVSGGGCGGNEGDRCPKCKSANVRIKQSYPVDSVMQYFYVCNDCNHEWVEQGYSGK